MKVRQTWRLYIILCSDQSLYTGITCNLRRRLEEHNLGKASRYTRTRRPVRLLYQEKYPNRSQATSRENEIKRWPREKKLMLIKKKKISRTSKNKTAQKELKSKDQ